MTGKMIWREGFPGLSSHTMQGWPKRQIVCKTLVSQATQLHLVPWLITVWGHDIWGWRKAPGCLQSAQGQVPSLQQGCQSALTFWVPPPPLSGPRESSLLPGEGDRVKGLQPQRLSLHVCSLGGRSPLSFTHCLCVTVIPVQPGGWAL